MYLCVCSHVYAHVCAYMKVCDQYQMFYPSTIHLPFWGCLPLNLELLALSRPSGLWTPEFSCPGLYSALITEVHHPTKIFMWVLGIRIPSWWLWAPRTLMANHLLSALALLSIATVSNKCYPCVEWHQAPPTEHGSPTMDHIMGENGLFFPQLPSKTSNSSDKGWGVATHELLLPSPCWSAD